MTKTTTAGRPAAGRGTRAQAADGAAGKKAAGARSGGRAAGPDKTGQNLKLAMDAVSTAVMMVDRDFLVTYVNKTSREMLETRADVFRQLWAGFDPARIVGTCIDVFHRNPQHQRQLLADPSRLPYRTDIQVGGHRFALNINGIFDEKGAYTGNILEWADVTETRRQQEVNADQASQLASISAHQAVIEFALDGTVLKANENFLKATGYTLEEIKGRHHSMFVDPAERETLDYRQFWERLARGEASTGVFRRLRKDGQELWLQASYNAVVDLAGKPVRVVKYASDITPSRRREADQLSQLESISKYQAVIEFKLDGTIVTANENFLKATGYGLEEIRGQHHALFVSQAERLTPEYKLFWEALAKGVAQAGQFRRVRKDGKDLWLQASYCPIFDLTGKPVKVIKYATDITAAREKEADQGSHLASLAKYQAVIEFKTDGTVVTANENFLRASGYTLEEIQGRHHSMFVDPAERTTPEYRQFWERMAKGLAEGGQYHRKRKDGGELWLQASYNPITDLSGTPVKVVKYAVDITAAKRLEQESERAVAEASAVLSAMAGGDLRALMQGEFGGSFATLRDAVNGCVTNLRSLVGQMRTTAEVIASSAGEIAQGNADLSGRTEQQAASIEETAASMEELTSTVKQNADNARQANQLAGGAREQATRGGTVVGSAISAMGSINDASKRIADIIGVIDEIAFQTNLLALNAAVEAARAGEQGRGFAVVAAEVRNLAQRSAGAAKEIKTLIKDSVAKVEEGSRLVNDSGSTLEQIVQSVKRVSDIIAEIAEASTEQSTGIERVSGAITQMDQAVQQNAALVEEASAAASSMSEQAQALRTLVAFFNTGDQPAPVAAPAAAPAAPAPVYAPVPRPAAPALLARPAAPAGTLYRRPVAAPAPLAARRPLGSVAPTPAPVQAPVAVAEPGAPGGRWEEF